ncbi:MAG: NTP transferase domain-containing protein [Chitinophagaceae bacterium]|nr:NTP transferase domain-containing protein [Chitinophagaceae bacterium]
MKAMIFAAGLGTRLKPFTDHSPKALAEVNGRSLLEHNIHYLQRYGINDVIINVHHFASLVVDKLNENNGFGSTVSVSDEQEALLETGGGLLKAIKFFEGESDFVVMNADILTSLDLGKMIDHHHKSGGMATLAIMKRDSSRQLLFNDDMTLCGWINNGTGEERISRADERKTKFSFSGVQVVSANLMKNIPFSGKFSMIDVYLHQAKNHIIKGFDHTGDLFIDVGKPGSIEQAERLFS